MKVLNSEDSILIYIKKAYILGNEKEKIKQIIYNLKYKYNLQLSGFYDIKVYNDKYYGQIIKIKKDNLDYFNYYTNQLDMDLAIEQNTFLYKVLDYFAIKNELNNFKIYKYKNNLYLKQLKPINDIKLGKIIEFSEIIFGEKSLNILEKE